MAKLFANSEDPDQTLQFAASDLGLHCLPITLSGVSQLQWIRLTNHIKDDTAFLELTLSNFLYEWTLLDDLNDCPHCATSC